MFGPEELCPDILRDGDIAFVAGARQRHTRFGAHSVAEVVDPAVLARVEVAAVEAEGVLHRNVVHTDSALDHLVLVLVVDHVRFGVYAHSGAHQDLLGIGEVDVDDLVGIPFVFAE